MVKFESRELILKKTMNPPIVTIEKFKYLVVHTGYTGRLVDKVEFLTKQIQGRCMHDDSDVEDGMPCRQCEDPILYIEDTCWGKGLELISKYKYDVDNVRNALAQMDRTYSGVIAFRCTHLAEAMTIVQMLVDVNYCACFNIRALISIKQIRDVLYLQYDAESG